MASLGARARMMRGAPTRLLLLTSALLLAPAGFAAQGILPGPPCDVPDVMPGAVRVDGGPTQAVRIRFHLDAPVRGTFAVWFALRAHVADASLPAERALAAGFLETSAGAPVATISPQLGIYPYGVQADAPVAGLRVEAADGACWGAFGAASEMSLAAGVYDLVVVGASEAGSRFAAFLPPGTGVNGTSTGSAALLSTATLPCQAKARAFVSGLLAEALMDCAMSLTAQGKAYRSLVATWGPSDEHDVRWVNPSGAQQRCYKAPGWCVDTGSGAAGTWGLEVPRYVTVRQPSVFLPSPSGDYSGIFGVFAGRP